jgi:hypothetical protein
VPIKVGDPVLLAPLKGGGYAAVPFTPVLADDPVILVSSSRNYYALKPYVINVGDKVLLVPVNGRYVAVKVDGGETLILVRMGSVYEFNATVDGHELLNDGFRRATCETWYNDPNLLAEVRIYDADSYEEIMMGGL